MKKWQIVLLCIAGAFVLLLAVIVVRALTFTSRQLQFEGTVTSQVDVTAAAPRLSQAIQFQTVSYEDRTQIDYAPFRQFQEYLVQTFPLIHSKLEKKVINNYALLYAWQGTTRSLKPMLIYGHHDVVPAADEDGKAWKYPPFSGAIAEGYVWGRGALDTKSSIMGALEAVEALLEEGFFPRRTVYIASGFDEEIGGEEGAKKIAELAASPATNASIRTTTAATMFNAGVKSNVLPSSASAIVNFRILPGDSVQGVMDRVNAVIDDPRVKIKVHGEFTEPSPVSDINSASFLTVYKTTKQVFPDALVAPSLVIATTDSKHFVGVAKNLYRLNPHRLGKDDLSMIHGVNEKISLENYDECIKFYMQLIRNSNE